MDKIKFFYAIKNVKQLGFGGASRNEELVIGVGHIIVNDMILCGTDKDKVKRQHDTRKSTTRMTWLKNVPLCPVCEKRYRENPRFAWKKWEQMVNETKF